MKKQNIIFILIVLLVIILIVGGVLLFKKEKVELEMIVTKGNGIYAINNIGEEIKIMDMRDYEDYIYTCKDDKLYLYLYTNKTIDGEKIENNFLAYIDLMSEDYELHSLSRATFEGTPVSIAVTNDYIYLVSTDYNGVYRYSFVDSSITGLSDFYDLNHVRLYSFFNNGMVYAEDDTLGFINIENEVLIKIAEGKLALVHDYDVIYKEYESDNSWVYKVYNINNEEINVISDEINTNQDTIIYYKDSYVYATNNMLYRYKDGTSEKIYEFNDYVNNVNIGPGDLLYVSYGNDDMVSLDIDTLKINSYEGEVYLNVLYIN